MRSFTARTAAEVLKVARREYEASIEDGRFVKPVEYQDSRGFVWQAERMLEGAAAELAQVDAMLWPRSARVLAKLKTAWPAPMPPDKPVLEVGKYRR